MSPVPGVTVKAFQMNWVEKRWLHSGEHGIALFCLQNAELSLSTAPESCGRHHLWEMGFGTSVWVFIWKSENFN